VMMGRGLSCQPTFKQKFLHETGATWMAGGGARRNLRRLLVRGGYIRT
jgi:hypothetical protein